MRIHLESASEEDVSVLVGRWSVRVTVLHCVCFNTRGFDFCFKTLELSAQEIEFRLLVFTPSLKLFKEELNH